MAMRFTTLLLLCLTVVIEPSHTSMTVSDVSTVTSAPCYLITTVTPTCNTSLVVVTVTPSWPITPESCVCSTVNSYTQSRTVSTVAAKPSCIATTSTNSSMSQSELYTPRTKIAILGGLFCLSMVLLAVVTVGWILTCCSMSKKERVKKKLELKR